GYTAGYTWMSYSVAGAGLEPVISGGLVAVFDNSRQCPTMPVRRDNAARERTGTPRKQHAISDCIAVRSYYAPIRLRSGGGVFLRLLLEFGEGDIRHGLGDRVGHLCMGVRHEVAVGV